MLQRIGTTLLLAVAALAVLLAVQPVASAPTAQTVYVDPINGNDTTGTGSLAAPWRSIKRALQSTAAGDTINALAGTYSTATGETFPINWPPGVKLMGAGRDATIIQGQSNQPVIYVGSASTDFYSDTVISGVTVRGGSEGVYLYSSQNHVNAATLLNLRAISNTDGIRIRAGTDYENGATVTPLISNTESVSNTNYGFYFRGYGHMSGSSVEAEVINSRARGNGAHGLYLDSCQCPNNTTVTARVVGSDFSHNQGNGVYVTAAGGGWVSLQIERSVLNGNSAQGFGWAQGYNTGNMATTLMNTVIASNQNGGVFLGDYSDYLGSGSVQLMNTTITHNGVYGIYWGSGRGGVSLSIVNSILWNLEVDDLISTSADLTTTNVIYSNIEDGDLNGEAGNFSADPLLDETYHLTTCSPAVDAGTLNGAPAVDFDGENHDDERDLDGCFAGCRELYPLLAHGIARFSNVSDRHTDLGRRSCAQ